MKKIALALIAIALTGAMAYAQDTAPVVKFSGYVDSGITFTKVDTGDFVSVSKANDDGANATVSKVGVSVTGAQYGAGATVKTVDLGTSGTQADAYAWYSPVEGLVLDAGSTYSKTSFDGVDDTSNDYFWANGLGATYSVSGFSVGVRVAPAATTEKLGFGAAYDLPKVATFRASAQTLGTALTNYAVSASLSAVEKLGLSAGYISEGNNATANNWADVSVSFAVTDAFSAGVTAHDKITKEYFTVKPNASFVAAPGVTLSAYYQLSTEGKDKVANPSDNEVQAKVAVAAGSGTISSWGQYNTAAKATVLGIDFVIGF